LSEEFQQSLVAREEVGGLLNFIENPTFINFPFNVLFKIEQSFLN